MNLLFSRRCAIYWGFNNDVVHALQKKSENPLMRPPLSYLEEKFPSFETLTTCAAS